jgi:hypothetical protein
MLTGLFSRKSLLGVQVEELEQQVKGVLVADMEEILQDLWELAHDN